MFPKISLNFPLSQQIQKITFQQVNMCILETFLNKVYTQKTSSTINQLINNMKSITL